MIFLLSSNMCWLFHIDLLILLLMTRVHVAANKLPPHTTQTYMEHLHVHGFNQSGLPHDVRFTCSIFNKQVCWNVCNDVALANPVLPVQSCPLQPSHDCSACRCLIHATSLASIRGSLSASCDSWHGMCVAWLGLCVYGCCASRFVICVWPLLQPCPDCPLKHVMFELGICLVFVSA